MSETIQMGGRFGFRISRRGQEYWVFLPHQCDEWTIAGEGPPAYEPGYAAALALTRMDEFIAEAQATRAKLAELIEGAGDEMG